MAIKLVIDSPYIGLFIRMVNHTHTHTEKKGGTRDNEPSHSMLGAAGQFFLCFGFSHASMVIS